MNFAGVSVAIAQDRAGFRTLASFIVLVALAFLAQTPAELKAQLILAGATAAIMLGAAFWRPSSRPLRIFVILLTVFTSTRYILWRLLETVPWQEPLSLPFALGLLFAEVYSYAILLLSNFIITDAPPRRPPAPVLRADDLPSIDILIPSYNEEPALLETTLIAALNINYPKEKLCVYLLDDGGTKQKRTQADALKAAEAEERHEVLQALCARVGAKYLTRARNEHAKAGNINAALEHVSGELILILDADHVPTRDILSRTVPYFVEDPKLFLVQTPHFFINPDPLERNLDTFARMPGENEMFYSVIQKGLDSYNASFFCGSAAILRRTHLNKIGGLAGDTITEDAETALELHSRGYRSAYLPRAMIAGLAPETFSGFIVQRMRWAQGMVQIFLIKSPLIKKGLTVAQRIGYMNSCFFWFFPLARFAFIAGPAAFLLLGVNVVDAGALEFTAYGLPHVLGAVLLSIALFGGVRWLFASELYEIIQCVHCSDAILKVLRNPRAPRFAVTPKGESISKDYISPHTEPFYAIVFIVALSEIVGITRMAVDPEIISRVIVLFIWNTVHLLLLICAVGVMFERAQRRTAPRPAVRKRLMLEADGAFRDVETADIAAAGVGVTIRAEIAETLRRGAKTRVLLEDPESGVPTPVDVVVVSKRSSGDDVQVGLLFDPRDLLQEKAAVDFVFGDSEVWRVFQGARVDEGGMNAKIIFLFARGAKRAVEHLNVLITGAIAA